MHLGISTPQPKADASSANLALPIMDDAQAFLHFLPLRFDDAAEAHREVCRRRVIRLRRFGQGAVKKLR